MTDTQEKSGRCLCGAVTITAKTVSHSAGACHCAMCRRWGGGPLMATDAGTDVAIDGEAAVTVFDSSPWADRGFCSKCGTHLFYRIKETKQYILPVGVLDDDEGLSFDHQVFIDEKPAYYRFENETEDMTGEELFAKYAPPN
ncbi:MAG: GFA family protein [Rhodospirillales bacterium]